MSTKFEGRSSYHEIIDDIVDTPTSAFNPIKILPNRTYSTYTSLPTALNKIDQQSIKIPHELRDRLQLTIPRSNSSVIMMNNDERRKEIDLILKHLYDGKLITSLNDDHLVSNGSDTPIIKTEKGRKPSIESLDVSIFLRCVKVNSGNAD